MHVTKVLDKGKRGYINKRSFLFKWQLSLSSCNIGVESVAFLEISADLECLVFTSYAETDQKVL